MTHGHASPNIITLGRSGSLQSVHIAVLHLSKSISVPQESDSSTQRSENRFLDEYNFCRQIFLCSGVVFPFHLSHMADLRGSYSGVMIERESLVEGVAECTNPIEELHTYSSTLPCISHRCPLSSGSRLKKPKILMRKKRCKH